MDEKKLVSSTNCCRLSKKRTKVLSARACAACRGARRDRSRSKSIDRGDRSTRSDRGSVIVLTDSNAERALLLRVETRERADRGHACVGGGAEEGGRGAVVI